MSAEQLTAFWAAVEGDPSLEETLKGAADLDAAVAVAKEAGFDVSKADLLEYQAQQTLELSDEDLEKVAGGTTTYNKFQQDIWDRWKKQHLDGRN